MADLHARYRPSAFKVWVDDVPQVTLGRTEAEVCGHAVQAAAALVRGLEALGCSISAKSLLLCSSSTLGTAILAGLARHGIKVRQATSGKDLGVDVHHSRRRRIPTQRKRLSMAGKRLRTIRSLMRASKKHECWFLQVQFLKGRGVWKPPVWLHPVSCSFAETLPARWVFAGRGAVRQWHSPSWREVWRQTHFCRSPTRC
jgi:hypothetical protein